jgi:hypothetical protein
MGKNTLPIVPEQRYDTRDVPASSLSGQDGLLDTRAEPLLTALSSLPLPSHRSSVDLSEEEIFREVEAIWGMDSKTTDCAK